MRLTSGKSGGHLKWLTGFSLSRHWDPLYPEVMEAVARLQDAIGAALLRTNLLGAEAVLIGGRYAVEAFLGRGASGVVVAAHDTRLDRPVALKLSLPGPGQSDLSEARALAKLDHPNIVRVHDADVVAVELGGRSWSLRVLVMQRVEAVSLRTWLRLAERSPDEILAVFQGGARGLAAAHAQHVVHRDFKPDNVLVRSDGVAQVLDFGFAITASSTRSATEGRPTEVAGTDAYLAPEARRGLASARADQYAFGVSMVEALTGRLERPSFWRPAGVPRHIWRTLRRATRRRPERRFESMDALLACLEPPRRWVRVAAAAALMVGGIGYAQAEGLLSVDEMLEEAGRHATELMTVAAPDAARPSVDSDATLDASVPPPDAVASTRAQLDELTDDASVDTSPPRADCLRIAPLGRRRIRTRSDSKDRHGCYFFVLDQDEHGCVAVAEVIKVASASTPQCWNGRPRAAAATTIAGPDGNVIVDTTIGGREYTFDLRSSDGELLVGDFASSLGGVTDTGPLVEVQ